MSLDTMSFILGGIFLATGLFGGGFEIKELRLPQINGVARLASILVGFCFIIFAVAFNSGWIKRPTEENKFSSESTAKTFETPKYKGFRLDVCVEFANRCGEEAATLWCQEQGYNRASDYPSENVGEIGVSTKTIGTDEVCKEKACTSFSRITCIK